MKDNRQQKISFVFTDIQGSTPLARLLDSAFSDLLAQYRDVVQRSVDQYSGQIIDSAGDGFFIVFTDVLDAVMATAKIQVMLAKTVFPRNAEVLVRIGIHSGYAVLSESTYTGLAVHRGF